AGPRPHACGAQARSGPPGHADDRYGHGQNPDSRRPPSPGRGDSQGRNGVNGNVMKTTKQAKREATQLFRLCLVNGLLDERRAREVVRQVVANRPRGGLGTLSYFRRLVALDRAQHTAKVESAETLTDELQGGVQAALARAYGPGLSISFS